MFSVSGFGIRSLRSVKVAFSTYRAITFDIYCVRASERRVQIAKSKVLDTITVGNF